MEKIGAYEAKTHLGQLLERARNGEEFLITKHGKPVARLVPEKAERREQILDDIKRLRELGRGHSLGPDLTIRQMIEEGRT